MRTESTGHLLRFAVLTHGGIAPYANGVHIPHLVETVRTLSTKADVEAFTLQFEGKPSAEYSIGNARVTIIPLEARAPLWNSVRMLVQEVLRAHRRSRFHLILGLWGFPAGIAAYIASRLAKVPNAVSFLGGETADVPSVGYGGMLRFPSRMLLTYLARHADQLHVLSGYQAYQLQQRGIRPHSLLVLPFGVSATRPSVSPPERSSSPRVLVHVANITEVKDQITLLKAFDIIRREVSVRLRIIGPDHRAGYIHDSVKHMGLSRYIEFTGQLTHAEVQEHLRSASLVIQTSRHESQGMVVVEAASHGIPVVTTRVGLGWDWEGLGILVSDPNDPVQIASQSLKILLHPEKYKHRVYKLIQISRQMSPEAFCDQIVARCRLREDRST
ncbi:MAG: hypothetical protein A3H45_00975 [Ignavibacteria bacterium RIFCSPLOWO2_02_FULL_55_14]|nr:MAG: hypothetical protein A3H45_00975 [Ignavibacteria bacterium RIFCSPLOWO2_02_FULL_55_14]